MQRTIAAEPAAQFSWKPMLPLTVDPPSKRVDTRQRRGLAWLAVVLAIRLPRLVGKSSGSVGSQMTAYKLRVAAAHWGDLPAPAFPFHLRGKAPMNNWLKSTMRSKFKTPLHR